MDASLLLPLAVAAGLGLLVGLQRERSHGDMAGIRTFPLVTLLGTWCGWIASEHGGWVVAAGIVALAGLTGVANLLRVRSEGEVDAGMTTEMAVLVMFVVGAALSLGRILEGVVVGAGVALLLHWKAPLHTFVRQLGSADVAAIMRLVLLTLVVLPVLPNRDYGPYGVLNPFEIWLMVVLIVGISLGGYVAFHLFGKRGGVVAAGVLGGLISSTATSVSYARRSANAPTRSPAAAVVIVLASTVVFARVLLELALVSRTALAASWAPLVATAGLMLVAAGVLWVRGIGDVEPEKQDRQPPSELASALVFGLLYAGVLLGVAWAQDRFGAAGTYVVAGLSGLTDMDAITLSTAQLMEAGELDGRTGWRIILVGALANLVFKAGIVVALGHRRLAPRVLGAFGFALVGGIGIFALWPG
jgi:uncharacterized membrane protein (DUF4010 family)